MKKAVNLIFVIEFVALTLLAPFFSGITLIAFLTSAILIITYIIGFSWIVVEMKDNFASTDIDISRNFYCLCWKIRIISSIIWIVVASVFIKYITIIDVYIIITPILIGASMIGVLLSFIQLFANKKKDDPDCD